MKLIDEVLEHFHKDTGELQNVLTRYVDSVHGYEEAAALIDHPGYASAFSEIAGRRKEIVHAVSKLIAEQQEKPEKSGSPEAQIHRWWMKVRAAMSEEEFRALLEECIRGESELLKVINETLAHGELKPEHYKLLTAVGAEVDMAIETFKTALTK